MFKFLKQLFLKRDQRPSEHYRLFESMTVFYVPPDSKDGQKSAMGEGLDLSMQSIRFAGQHPLRRKEVIELDLRFQGDYAEPRTVTVHGRVIRSVKKGGQRRYRTLCEFQDLNENEKQELTRFLNWLAIMNANAHYRYGPSA